jgi:hypothetical protein
MPLAVTCAIRLSVHDMFVGFFNCFVFFPPKKDHLAAYTAFLMEMGRLFMGKHRIFLLSKRKTGTKQQNANVCKVIGLFILSPLNSQSFTNSHFHLLVVKCPNMGRTHQRILGLC